MLIASIYLLVINNCIFISSILFIRSLFTIAMVKHLTPQNCSNYFVSEVLIHISIIYAKSVIEKV